MDASRPAGKPTAAADSAGAAVAMVGLTRRFGNLLAVDHVDCSIAPRTIFGLLGTNGAGKSTVIKMLTTLLPVSEGSARVAGFDVTHEARAVRNHIGYVPQMLSADGELTGYENLLISAKLYGIRPALRRERIEQALAFMELEDSAGRRVAKYSGGMIRRLEIAQAMLHRPAVLFLDEPTVGLDPAARHAVWQRIRDLRHEFGTTILLTTHDMDEADKLCEELAFMDLGKIVAGGRPAELKAQIGPEASLEDVFMRYTGSSLLERGDFRNVQQTRRTASRLE